MHDESGALARRDFVRSTVGAAVTASLLGESLQLRAAPTVKSWVAVVRNQEALNASNQVNEPVLRQMLTHVLKAVIGKAEPAAAWRALVREDDIVSLVHTDHLNRTHPELVSVVTATLKESGITEGNIWMVQGSPDKVRKCNALISLPALKAHWLTGIGTNFKNYITFTGSPSSYHDADNAKLGEIWNMPHVKDKTRLVLVDALRPLCDKGPQPDPRYSWQYKGLIAGTDPVAVETVCLKIILQRRHALRGEPWPLSPPRWWWRWQTSHMGSEPATSKRSESTESAGRRMFSSNSAPRSGSAKAAPSGAAFAAFVPYGTTNQRP